MMKHSRYSPRNWLGRTLLSESRISTGCGFDCDCPPVGASRPPSRMPRVKLTGRKVETVLGVVADAGGPSRAAVPSPPAGGRARSASVIREITGVGGAGGAGGCRWGGPAGIAPKPLAVGGGAGGRLAAGGMAVGLGSGAVGVGGGGAAGFGAAACWLAVRRCSSSAKRCIVLPSKACRSLLSRLCSSRSVSYWASFRPAVPTHWSTGFTWPPGGRTPMLVTSPGCVGAARPCGWWFVAEKLKISHSRPMPPPRMAASRAY